jgi:hypothetical protein
MLSRFATLGGLPPDPYFSSVSLLLNGDTLTDLSSSPKTITAHGNTQISTGTKKFGTGALYFDGNGDCLYSPSNSGFYLNPADYFTIEMWINPTLIAGTTPRLIDIGVEAAADFLVLDFVVSSNLLRFGTQTATGAAISTWAISYTGIPATNTWTHIAISCAGTGTNQVKLFINGTLSASGTISSMGSNCSIWIGGITWVSATQYSYTGYIDDLRITKGIARYTTSFTPPTAAFPTS